MPITHHSLWRANANSNLISSPLSSDLHCELVIIGAGYSGLCAALHAAEQGMRVHVLEANTVGHGGSGRNVGLVNAGLWTPPDEVETALGQVAGITLNHALAAAPELVFSLIEKHQIECEALRHGTLHCASNNAGLRQLKQRLAQQVKRHAPVTLLGASDTFQRTGSCQFLGALLDPRAGTLQPLNYALGLAHAATRAGAVIHTQSPVITHQRKGNHWLVNTAHGSVTADKLIHATNAYDTLLPRSTAFTSVDYVQFATQPLTLQQRTSVLPNGEGCWDTNQVMSSFRMDQSGRLIIGGVGSLDGKGKGTHINWAHRKLRALFPQITQYKFEYMWHGHIAMTTNHLPKITQLGTNGIRLYGYSGRGIGPGTLFGKAAAQWAFSGNEDHLPVAITNPKPETYTHLKATFFDMGATLSHWLSCRL